MIDLEATKVRFSNIRRMSTLILALSACSSSAGETPQTSLDPGTTGDPPSSTSGSGTEAPGDTGQDPSNTGGADQDPPVELCSGRAWLVQLRPDATCDELTASSWLGTPLFPDATGALARFCRLEWTSLDAPPPQPDESFQDVWPVCPTYSPQGANAETCESAGEAPFLAAFDAYADRPAEDSPVAGASPTTIVLLDTESPETAASCESRGTHGCILGKIVQRLTCAGSVDCPIVLRYTQALRWRIADSAPTRSDGSTSGQYGTPDDVAEAIWQAMAPWRAGTGSGRPLLILALGGESPDTVSTSAWRWDDVVADADATLLSLEDRVVLGALGHASCMGAWIFSAAGNLNPGCSGTGMTAPGGWMFHPAPTEGECERLFGGDHRADHQPGEALGFAVTGLGNDGRPLANARAGSLSMFAAIGIYIEKCHETAGSSVSTAVETAAAALVATHAPRLSIHALGDLLHTSAAPLQPALPADAWAHDLGPAEVRRLQTCHAAQTACERVDGDCGYVCDAGDTHEDAIATAMQVSIDAFTLKGFGCMRAGEISATAASVPASVPCEAGRKCWPLPGSVLCSKCVVVTSESADEVLAFLEFAESPTLPRKGKAEEYKAMIRIAGTVIEDAELPLVLRRSGDTTRWLDKDGEPASALRARVRRVAADPMPFTASLVIRGDGLEFVEPIWVVPGTANLNIPKTCNADMGNTNIDRLQHLQLGGDQTNRRFPMLMK